MKKQEIATNVANDNTNNTAIVVANTEDAIIKAARALSRELIKAIKVDAKSLNSVCRLFADTLHTDSKRTDFVRKYITHVTSAKELAELLKSECYSYYSTLGINNTPTIWVSSDKAAGINKLSLETRTHIKWVAEKSPAQKARKGAETVNVTYKRTEITLVPIKKTAYTIEDAAAAFIRLIAKNNAAYLAEYAAQIKHNKRARANKQIEK